MRGFELAHPRSLAEATSLLATDDPSVRPLSGGTALMLMMKAGVFQPSLLVNLDGIGPRYSEVSATPEGGLEIGAMATLSALERSETVRKLAPVVPKSMLRLANVRVRHVARLGGNLAHGDPHMDLPPILSTLGAEVTIQGPDGERSVPLEGFFTGYYETVLQPGELITRVSLPSQLGWSSSYQKCSTRSADDWPALGVAVSVRLENGSVAESRIMVSAATEKLTRLRGAEAVLDGAVMDDDRFEEVAEIAAGEVETIEDARGSAEYKSQLLRVYLKRALTEAFSSEAVR